MNKPSRLLAALALAGSAFAAHAAATITVISGDPPNVGFNDPTAAENATAVRAELTTELGRIDATVSSRLASGSYTAPPSAATNAAAVRTELTTELGRIDAVLLSPVESAALVPADD